MSQRIMLLLIVPKYWLVMFIFMETWFMPCEYAASDANLVIIYNQDYIIIIFKNIFDIYRADDLYIMHPIGFRSLFINLERYTWSTVLAIIQWIDQLTVLFSAIVFIDMRQKCHNCDKDEARESEIWCAFRECSVRTVISLCRLCITYNNIVYYWAMQHPYQKIKFN